MQRQHLARDSQADRQSRSLLSSRPRVPTCSPLHPLLQLQRTIGNQAVGRLLQSRALQAKLRVGRPGDLYEQEADRVADQVMRMPEPVETGAGSASPNIQRKCAACASGQGLCPKCAEQEALQRKPLAASITPLVQRQPENEEEGESLQTKSLTDHITLLVQRQEEPPEEEEDKEENLLQAKATPGFTPQVTPNLESRINNMKIGGQPLPESTRSFFEPRFGADFSSVRVHADALAAETAQTVNARAFTAGQNVVFGMGQYSPGTASGQRLLGHELTHVVQQRKRNGSFIQRQIALGPATLLTTIEELLKRPRTLKKAEEIRKEANKLFNLLSASEAQAFLDRLIYPQSSDFIPGRFQRFHRAIRKELLEILIRKLTPADAEISYIKLTTEKRLRARFRILVPKTKHREHLLAILLNKLIPNVLPDEEITKEDKAKEEAEQRTTTTMPPKDVKQKCGELEDAQFVGTRKLNDMVEVRGYHKGLCCAYFGIRGFLGKWPKERPLLGSSYTWEVKAGGAELRLIVHHPLLDSSCQWGFSGSAKITIIEVKGCYRLSLLLFKRNFDLDKYPGLSDILRQSDPQICLVGNSTVDITPAQSKNRLIRISGAVSGRIDLDLKVPNTKFKISGRLAKVFKIGFIELGMDRSGKISASGKLEWSWSDIDNLFKDLPGHINIEVTSEPEPVLPPDFIEPPTFWLPTIDIPLPWWEKTTLGGAEK